MGVLIHGADGSVFASDLGRSLIEDRRRAVARRASFPDLTLRI